MITVHVSYISGSVTLKEFQSFQVLRFPNSKFPRSGNAALQVFTFRFFVWNSTLTSIIWWRHNWHKHRLLLANVTIALGNFMLSPLSPLATIVFYVVFFLLKHVTGVSFTFTLFFLSPTVNILVVDNLCIYMFSMTCAWESLSEHSMLLPNGLLQTRTVWLGLLTLVVSAVREVAGIGLTGTGPQWV